MNYELFDQPEDRPGWQERIGPASLVMRGFALKEAAALLQLIEQVAAESPFRRMRTPGGHTMSVAMTSCGQRGWVTDRLGYRYSPTDPLNQRPWPAMPALFGELAERAATEAGFPGFAPDACLINRYQAGAKMSLHQDKDEQDLAQPIVSLSLGLSAVFLFGGLERGDKTARVTLTHGDAVVWGDEDRLRFHGILPLKPGLHEMTGEFRYNLTFRHS